MCEWEKERDGEESEANDLRFFLDLPWRIDGISLRYASINRRESRVVSSRPLFVLASAFCATSHDVIGKKERAWVSEWVYVCVCLCAGEWERERGWAIGGTVGRCAIVSKNVETRGCCRLIGVDGILFLEQSIAATKTYLSRFSWICTAAPYRSFSLLPSSSFCLFRARAIYGSLIYKNLLRFMLRHKTSIHDRSRFSWHRSPVARFSEKPFNWSRY